MHSKQNVGFWWEDSREKARWYAYSEFCSLDKGCMLERGRVNSPPLKFGLRLFYVFADCKGRGGSHAGLMPRPFNCQWNDDTMPRNEPEELPLKQKTGKENCRPKPKSSWFSPGEVIVLLPITFLHTWVFLNYCNFIKWIHCIILKTLYTHSLRFPPPPLFIW